MPETQSAPASNPSSFASVLSSLTSPTPGTATPWDGSALAPDVAVISYERALRAQSRMKPTDSAASNPPHPPRGKSGAPRAAIVTLRLSHAESTQLHERAAEAGLTVSAYIRSCVFEVESLRTQVREALAQLRSAASPAPQDNRSPAQSPLITWRNRLFSFGR